MLFPQDKMFIHRPDNITTGILLSDIIFTYFDSTSSTIYFGVGDSTFQYIISEIDSISFGSSSDTVYIVYNNSSVSVVNPFAFNGVAISVDGTNVIINSTSEEKDINYILSGSTTDGMFKVYSKKRFNLFLDGISITNQDGPAINIQSDNKSTITLVDGTSNIFTDGINYPDSVINEKGETEDQVAAFFSEGQMVFNGSGNLIINANGVNQHALFSKDKIQIDDGNITITYSANDGIHAKDGIEINGGIINVTAASDAIDGGKGYIIVSGGNIITSDTAEGSKGFTCDSTLSVLAGTINITVSGDGSKGMISGQNVTLTGGIITINSTGNAVLEASGLGYNPSYCIGIKSDSNIFINGASIKITCTGVAGKGISSEGNINITNGTVEIKTTGGGATYKNSSGNTDCYHATCLTADGNISIVSGSVTISSSGSAGKGITAGGMLIIGDVNDAPVINITTTGAKITISGGTGPGGGGPGGGTSGDYAEAKAVSCDGAVTINNGLVTIKSSDDGIKSTVSVTINNGNVSITNSVEGIESPYITINNGTVSIVASDDGFNATKSTVSGGTETNDGSCVYLNGGNVYVNTSVGDGIDSNGNLVMTGGTVVVQGPPSQPEVGMDVNGTRNISGGLLIVSGPNSGNMIEAPSTTSTQYSILATTSSMLNSSTLFHIQDANGTGLVTFKPIKSVYYIVFSSPELKSSSTYYIYTGGTSTGTNNNGLITDGTYSGGTLKKSFSISGKVTNVTF